MNGHPSDRRVRTRPKYVHTTSTCGDGSSAPPGYSALHHNSILVRGAVPSVRRAVQSPSVPYQASSAKGARCGYGCGGVKPSTTGMVTGQSNVASCGSGSANGLRVVSAGAAVGSGSAVAEVPVQADAIITATAHSPVPNRRTTLPTPLVRCWLPNQTSPGTSAAHAVGIWCRQTWLLRRAVGDGSIGDRHVIWEASGHGMGLLHRPRRASATGLGRSLRGRGDRAGRVVALRRGRRRSARGRRSPSSSSSGARR